MQLSHLFKVQEIMENNIKHLSQIDENELGKENIFDLRFLALQVKVGELANLTKCYKYTRMKEDIPKDKLMFRFIDAMRFFLSIGNQFEFNIINLDAVNKVSNEDSLVKVFSSMFDNIRDLKYAIKIDNYVDSLNIYIKLFTEFINLGKLLGFTFEEVYDYYLKQASEML